MKLSLLSFITTFLFAISIVVFHFDHKRGTDLSHGSDYIKGLDVAGISKIKITSPQGEELALEREKEYFVIANHKSYPASNGKINNLIYQLANIQIDKKISSSTNENDLKNYHLDKKQAYQIEIFDEKNEITLAFYIGADYKGKGNYLYKEKDKNIYLSSESIRIDTSYKSYIDNTLLELQTDQIKKISVISDSPIEIVKEENDYVLKSPENQSIKKDKLQEYLKNLSKISFDEYFTPQDDIVKSLNFNKSMEIDLNNNLIYRLSFAEAKDHEYFLKVSASLENIPSEIVVHQNADKNELKSVENAVQAKQIAELINSQKSPWIYKISKEVFEKLVKDDKQLM